MGNRITMLSHNVMDKHYETYFKICSHRLKTFCVVFTFLWSLPNLQMTRRVATAFFAPKVCANYCENEMHSPVWVIQNVLPFLYFVICLEKFILILLFCLDIFTIYFAIFSPEPFHCVEYPTLLANCLSRTYFCWKSFFMYGN